MAKLIARRPGWWPWRKSVASPSAAPVVPLVVPDEFNRNSVTVTSLMPPEQSGIWLLERMRQQTGLSSYATTKLLDFGCGVRFSQAIINTGLPFGRYVGVDSFSPMIDFLRGAVRDPRFAYHSFDARNALYSPGGKPFSAETNLPLAEHDFDIICMFSVITHQSPADSESILKILRRHIAPHGQLFFTCFLDPTIPSFEDRSPEKNTGRCFYNPRFLEELIARSGWKVVGAAPAEAPLIGDSFVSRPA